MITNRIELAKHFASLGFTRGAEIGVADGRYSQILCESINGLELIGVDVWAKYEGNWRSDEYQDRAYQEARAKLKDYHVRLIRDTSLNASLDVPDHTLDFVFIDGSHTFDNVMLDILLWTPKVRKGGILSGHDYGFFHDSGIVEAVNKYTEVHKIELNVIPRDPKAFKDDQIPCWYFVKP
jgi:hypothetical protein